MMRPTRATLQKQVDAWNTANAVGAEVDAQLDGGEVRRTKTRRRFALDAC